ncbi:MAG: 30S ribosomal protein S6 [Acidobacteria bacterium]|nr:MAG: 30S ribosomal protein S6 [Acidobacteriota bacterium]
MSFYETLILTAPHLTDEEQDQIAATYTAVIEGQKGTVRKADKWGKRVLAYPINKITEGVYTLIEFTGDGKVVTELDRKLKIDENVMRHIIVNQDHDIKLKERADAKAKKKQRPVKVEAEAPAVETTTAPETKEEA